MPVLAQPTYTVFLLGDAGAPLPDGKDPALNVLRSQLDSAGRNSCLILLGDNVYQYGMPGADDDSRPEAERRLRDQLDLAKAFPGRLFAIPGNHDWNKDRRGGLARVLNQQYFISQYTGKDDIFYPKDGCPGPVEVRLTDSLTLVLMDTQYWLYPFDKPGIESDCRTKNLTDFLAQFDDILYRNRRRHVVVAGHHPMYSYGNHGGKYGWRDHLFPLTALNKSLYIPLPIIGSIYPLYRSIFGNVQDIPHPTYQRMRNGMIQIMSRYRNLIYVNGHDHNLQLIQHDGQSFITSGSGSKTSIVDEGKHAIFVAPKQGFARLDFQKGRSVTVSFYEASSAEPKGKKLFETITLLSPTPTRAEVADATEPDTVLIAPSKQYEARKFKRWLLGENYRTVWSTPIAVPRLRLSQAGLTPTERGGGQQTLSLRLIDKAGHEYQMRSVEKFPEKAIPENLRSGLVEDIVQDQISASHPYAALVAADLAEAAGVLHPNPRLVVPADERALGEYRRTFANSLMLLEERADGNYKGTGLFGNSEKIQSTAKVLEKLQEDNDNRVNQQSVVRARLLDIWIGDWDRHEDQWRWASFKDRKGTRYEPIPRDRDQAFFVNEGIIPRIAKLALPKVQGFKDRIRDVEGLNFNARHFDRTFLTEPSREDWLATADSLQNRLTDEVIGKALRKMPQSAYQQTGADIASRLQKRRDDLKTYADQYYRFLAKNVDVVGSDKDELFQITRQPDGRTKVEMFNLKDGKPGDRMYSRVFDPLETKEIRVYGLGGPDRFVIGGSSPKASLLRLIGGRGNDQFTDSSRVDGMRHRTHIYDLKKNTTVAGGPETRVRLSDRESINAFSRKYFEYDGVKPLISVQYNTDDGLFLGAGAAMKIHGFRRSPYAQLHRVFVNRAFLTGAFNLHYNATITDVIGRTDLNLLTDIKGPNFANNFFGLGNETTYDRELGIPYYRFRYDNYVFSALFQHQLGKPLTLYYGPAAERVAIVRGQEKFVRDFATQQPDGENLFNSRWYGGMRAGYTIDLRNDPKMTTRGLFWNTDLTAYRGIDRDARAFTQLQSELAFYAAMRLPFEVVAATRFGGSFNLSRNYEFFQASTLGGLTNLRGFRRTRFAGDHAVYNNLELRAKVLTIKTYLVPAFAGVHLFSDVGRVWLRGENSQVWHHGWGGGVWIAPYNSTVLSFTYAISREDRIPLVRLGFFF